jgi:hypothetical protein|tara:strand:- start:341 stop:700 length:360 start_codon:yes stop_codon:yes gene_type:complete
METKKYITILDFEKSKVFQYQIIIPLNELMLTDDYVDFLTEKGHNVSNCEWMAHDEHGIVTKFKSEIKEEIKSSEQFQEEMEKGNPDNDFSEYEKGYTDGLTFAQGVVDKVFTKKRNHG